MSELSMFDSGVADRLGTVDSTRRSSSSTPHEGKIVANLFRRVGPQAVHDS